VSAAVWWGFEVLNWRLGNWEYLGVADLRPVLRVVLQSVGFATVVPALLSTTELVGSLVGVKTEPLDRETMRVPPAAAAASVAAGAGLLGLLLAFPRVLFPAAWLFVIPLLEPANMAMGGRSVGWFVHRRSWRAVVAVALAGLQCGFLWELWNNWSYPKWQYHIPFFDSPSLFAMPLFGYLGYPFLALEVLTVVTLLAGLVARRTSGRGDCLGQPGGQAALVDLAPRPERCPQTGPTLEGNAKDGP